MHTSSRNGAFSTWRTSGLGILVALALVFSGVGYWLSIGQDPYRCDLPGKWEEWRDDSTVARAFGRLQPSERKILLVWMSLRRNDRSNLRAETIGGALQEVRSLARHDPQVAKIVEAIEHGTLQLSQGPVVSRGPGRRGEKK